VAPVAFNTVNKWAIGISDTLALGILCEAYGMGVDSINQRNTPDGTFRAAP
jgi:flavoprotein